MAAIIQAKCPRCKHQLRIPSDWLGSALKCKHCGELFRAKGNTERAPASRAVTSAPSANGNGDAKPAPAKPSPIVASRPTRPPLEGSNDDLTALDDKELQPSEIGKARYKRRAPAIPMVPLLIGICAFFVVVSAVVAAIIIWPNFKSHDVASASSSSDDDKSSKKGSGRQRPGRSGRSTPIDQHTELSGDFPNRRALIISVNNYLYMNPTLYGSTHGDQPRNITTLMDRFRTGLRIPRTQMAQVSDAAPANPIKPSKIAINEAIDQFLKGVREEDCLLLMFAGHIVDASPAEGMPEEACLVPLEGVPTKGETLIPLSGLIHQLELSPARQKVLILDVCRLNPGRGLELPGSGPQDADTPGAMWDKLDQQLAQPPDGVQVWVSCLKDQFSYELEQDFNNSVFLHALDVALMKIVENRIQYPEEPMPLQDLVDLVNTTVKDTLAKYTSAKDKRAQVSRLTGSIFEGGLTYDEEDEQNKPLPKLVVKDPVAKEGAAKPEDLKKILTEMAVPLIRSSKKNAPRDPVPPIDLALLPYIAADDLKDYLTTEDATPDAYRKMVDKARNMLKTLPILDEELLALVPPKTEPVYLGEIEKRQHDVATRISKLESLAKEMDQGDKADRDNASRHWRANFDFLKTRVQAQIAYSYEVNSALGAARKKDTPNLDKELQQNGWRMAATTKPQGDKTGKDTAKARLKLLHAMEEDYKGTPWEVVARREEFAALGVEWQPAQIGAK